MNVHYFYDKGTATCTYIISCLDTKSCIVIDPVLNFDACTGRITYKSLEAIEQYIDEHQLSLVWILETHVHADHLTGAALLKQKCGGKCVIGEGIHAVIDYWAPKYNLNLGWLKSHSSFDQYLKHGDVLSCGNLNIHVMYTPGHTEACISYYINDALFVGDTLFSPKRGTARCDFPGGSAKELYQSIKSMYKLPDSTRVYTGHDYPEAGQEPTVLSTIKEQKENNILLNQYTSEAEYVKARNERDRCLGVPKLLLFALQVNLAGGVLPPEESNGMQYLKIPLTVT